MGRVDKGYAALAAAVIESAVKDVKHGKAVDRRLAMQDIEDGGLDPWIDLLCATHDVYDQVQEGLRKVLMARSA